MSECDEEVVFENNQEIQIEFKKNSIQDLNILGLNISSSGQSIQALFGGEQSFGDLFKIIKDEINAKLDDAIELALGE